LHIVGEPASARSVTIADQEKWYLVDIDTSSSVDVTITNTAGTGVTFSGNKQVIIYCDGASTRTILSEISALDPSQNLADLQEASAARSNLGLGGMAVTSVDDYYVKASVDAEISVAVINGRLPTRVYYSETSSFTFNVPTGVSVVYVEAAGAGGGAGGVGGDGTTGEDTTVTDGSTLITGSGGGGGRRAFGNNLNATDNGTATNGDLNIKGGGASGGLPGASKSGTLYDHGSPGGNGGKAIKTYSGLTGGSSTLTITVGAGGAGAVGADNPTDGVDGFVIIEY